MEILLNKVCVNFFFGSVPYSLFLIKYTMFLVSIAEQAGIVSDPVGNANDRFLLNYPVGIVIRIVKSLQNNMVKS